MNLLISLQRPDNTWLQLGHVRLQQRCSPDVRVAESFPANTRRRDILFRTCRQVKASGREAIYQGRRPGVPIRVSISPSTAAIAQTIRSATPES